jgi:hypothetical protein
MAKAPSPERVYEVINTILQRRYDVKIEYTLEMRPAPRPIFSTPVLRKSNNNQNQKGVAL